MIKLLKMVNLSDALMKCTQSLKTPGTKANNQILFQETPEFYI